MQTQTNCCYNKKMEINTGGIVCLLCNETFKGDGKAVIVWRGYFSLKNNCNIIHKFQKRVKKSKEVAIKRGPTQKDVTTEVNIITL